jgi:hypothetical protein
MLNIRCFSLQLVEKSAPLLRTRREGGRIKKDGETGYSSGIICPEPSHKGVGFRHVDGEGWEEIIRGIVEGVEFLQSRVGSICPPVTYRAMEKDVWWGIHNESR